MTEVTPQKVRDAIGTGAFKFAPTATVKEYLSVWLATNGQGITHEESALRAELAARRSGRVQNAILLGTWIAAAAAVATLLVECVRR
jgi:hypothetical protein